MSDTRETFLPSRLSPVHQTIIICLCFVCLLGFFFNRVGVDPDEDLKAVAESQVCRDFRHTLLKIVPLLADHICQNSVIAENY